LPALQRALDPLGGTVTRLILTHPHEDHMGSAAALGSSATVLAHAGTTEAMREPYVFMPGVELPPKQQSAYPDSEIAADTAFVSNGEEVRVAATPAHTGADVVVYFTQSRVAHFGDTYLAGNPMMFPGNEDADGFLNKLESLLDSMHPEKDR
jgi:glyoxylase-like metal-dependent hydrolase (beta-lactamase superfamily II)